MPPMFKLSDKPLGDARVDLQVALVWEDAPLSGAAKDLDKTTKGALAKLIKGGTFRGKEGETFLYPSVDTRTKFYLLLGLGNRADSKLNTVRAAGGYIIQAAQKGQFKTLAIPVADFATSGTMDDDAYAHCAQALCEGMVLRDYEFEDYRTSKDPVWHVGQVTLAVPKTAKNAIQKGIDHGVIFGESANFARTLITHPPNTKTPTYLAERAKEVAEMSGGSTKLKVLGRRDCEKLGMGSFLGVAAGSDTEPKFIVLEYRCGVKGAATVALVGKAITFDTGGISIKPAQGMESMKCDMSGGAGVLGAMMAVSRLQPEINVIGIVPATDNMPDGKAIHPSDILRSQKGVSIEIISTDAEGRLILADGLEYAQQYNPDATVDMATLTGACVVALGSVYGGIMGNNSNLTKQLIRAGRQANEKLWELPLDKEYMEQIKSPIADVKNSGGREAGSITAGMFLSKFVGNMNWAHLDIAGMAWDEKGKPYMEKGATGYGVRLLTTFILEFERPAKSE